MHTQGTAGGYAFAATHCSRRAASTVNFKKAMLQLFAPFGNALRTLGLLLVSTLLAADGYGQCDNQKPLFGDNCNRSAAVLKADQRFRQNAVQQHGSAVAAARFYRAAGWQEFKNGKPGAAMEKFNQAWLLDPEAPETYFAFGHLVRYAFGKNAPEAERFYKLGRMRDAGQTAEKNSLLQLLAVLEKNYDPEAAIDASSQLIQSFPDFEKGLGYKTRGYYYTSLQMPDRAVLDLNKALEIDPRDPNVYLSRGYAYAWQRNHQQALADYNQAISLNPAFAEAYANRAVLYADSLNQPQTALPDIEKALELDSRQAKFYQTKSNILFKLNRPTEACATLQNAMAKGFKTLAPEFKKRCGK